MELPCKDCVSGYVLPGDVKGAFADGAYFSPAPSRHEGEKAAIVLLTDSFGLQLKNPKILADFFADRLGCDAFVPDLFHGSPPINERDLAPYIKDEPGQPRGIIETLKWLAVMVPLLPGLFANRPSVGLARAEAFLRGIKESKGYTRVGVVGYCYGGGVALGIATRTGLVDAVVACHPGPVDIDDVRNSTTPLAMLCADEDEWLSPHKRNLAEVALRENHNVPSKLVVFPGTTHGFAARPNLGIPKVREGFEGALEEATAWFEKYLF